MGASFEEGTPMISSRPIARLAGLAGLLLAASAYEAAAASWYCTAHSPRAYGWGKSPNLASAKRTALSECAVRTPRGQTCRITSCR